MTRPAALVGRVVSWPRRSTSAIASETLTSSSSKVEADEAELKGDYEDTSVAIPLSIVEMVNEMESSGEMEEAEEGEEEKKGLIEEIRETVKKYGVAGVLALAVEVMAFNFLVILPAAVVLFHQQSGLYIPTPATSGKFYGALGSVYLFCKLPPIEVARLAFTFKIVPWVERKMPEDWRDIDLEEKFRELTASPHEKDSQ